MSYVQKIKQLSKSTPFIIGCVLITVGTFGLLFFDFTWISALDTAFSVVHIIALWLLVFEAFSDRTGKIFTALSMFRVSAVIALVSVVIAFGLMGIIVLFSTLPGILFLFFLALVGGIGYVIIRYYFLALLKVLDGIKERITTGNHTELEGLGSFLVLSYIAVGISVFSAFADMAGDYTPQRAGAFTGFEPAFDAYGHIAYMIPISTAFEYAATVEPFVFSWSVIFVIANGTGMILCLRILKRFE